MRLSIVDVFAERVYEGNQLAVVRDAASLSPEAMQQIALEMNFSETTFVIDEAADRATVRIFTPVAELPFAGHPTLGTAWVLTGGKGQIQLELGVGPVAVSFESGIGWMTPPEPTLGAEADPADAAALLGLQRADLHTELPVQHAQIGPSFLFVSLQSLAALRRASLDPERYRALGGPGGAVSCVCAFTDEPYDAASHYAMRVFFDAQGIREDPATGSANTAFAAYLRRHRGNLGSVVVAQGHEIRRPSRLYLEVGAELRVGGRVFQSIEGELC